MVFLDSGVCKDDHENGWRCFDEDSEQIDEEENAHN
jgi:hypothetical protein